MKNVLQPKSFVSSHGNWCILLWFGWDGGKAQNRNQREERRRAQNMQALSLNIVTNSKADSKDLALNERRSIIYFELRLYILILSLFFIQKSIPKKKSGLAAKSFNNWFPSTHCIIFTLSRLPYQTFTSHIPQPHDKDTSYVEFEL